MIHTAISMFHDYHCPILRNSFPPVRYAPVQSDWVPVRLVTQSFWGTPSPTGYLKRTGTQSDWVPQKDWDPVGLGDQSTSHDWNWCIPTSRVFETRIFLSSNFKKMRKYRFYWWSYFVDLFMIEVLNDFGLLKRIYVFWSKGDSVGPVTQSDWVPSRDWVPVGLGTQSGLGTSPTGWPVRLVPSHSHPVGDWNWCIPNCNPSRLSLRKFLRNVTHILKSVGSPSGVLNKQRDFQAISSSCIR